MRIVKLFSFVLPLFFITTAESCDGPPTADQVQQSRQETILKEGASAVGMPSVKNFQEMRNLKQIIELRDQTGLVTYTYLFSEVSGKLTFFCNSIGYGIPYATQYTNPQKVEWHSSGGYINLPQADPNGLFSPASAEGTWVQCLDPNGTKEVRPTYIEPRIVVSQFKLPTN